jgi:hypothetical protein
MHYSLNTRHGSKILLVLAVVLIGNSAFGAESPLRWKFKEGDSLNYVLNRNVEGKLVLSGSPIGIKMGMAFDTTWNTKSVGADGTANVEQTIDRIQISMSSPLGGGDLSYDSKKTDSASGVIWQQIGPMVEGMLGQTFKVKISPLGRVSDIELPAKLNEAIQKQQQSPNRQAGFGIGGGAFSEKGIKELIEKSVLPLPEAVPAKDVTWMQHFENVMRGMGTQMSDTTFSHSGQETQDGKQLEKITAVTELTFEPVENPMADLEITSQEGTAAFYFDAQAGRMVKASGTQVFAMEISGARELTQELKETMSMTQGKSP